MDPLASLPNGRPPSSSIPRVLSIVALSLHRVCIVFPCRGVIVAVVRGIRPTGWKGLPAAGLLETAAMWAQDTDWDPCKNLAKNLRLPYLRHKRDMKFRQSQREAFVLSLRHFVGVSSIPSPRRFLFAGMSAPLTCLLTCLQRTREPCLCLRFSTTLRCSCKS